MSSLSPASIIYDSSGNPVGVVLDGAVYRLQVAAKIARASDGALVNPASEETLDAIKDTDGIKKITDALPAGDNNIGNVDLASAIPAGTNEIGKVAQGTKAAGTEAWPGVLYDAAGNSVSVYPRGTLHMLGVRDAAVLHELRVIVEYLSEIKDMLSEITEEDDDG